MIISNRKGSTDMPLNTLVLESSPNREVRHATLLNAVREFFNNPEIEIEYTRKGKPELKGINRYISVTTVEDKMICVISENRVGIDGEHLSRFTGETKTDFPAIAERFFTEEEAEYVRDGEDTGVRFAKIWVRKEAYSKYTGKGLADFSNFSVNDGERFFGKVNGVTIKKHTVNFPGSNEYLFAVAGENL